MKSIIDKARKIHRNQKGFTLIELLVVLAILALIVGLIVPNFFGVIGEAEWVQIAGQHEKMREAVFLYFEDTATWPTELSDDALVSGPGVRELWGDPPTAGWDGPYIDRPILQENRWWDGTGATGMWGVQEDQELHITTGSNVGGSLYTALVYEAVPFAVAEALDEGMDDGAFDTGAVQFIAVVNGWPSGNTMATAPVAGDTVNLVIIIAQQ